MVSTDEKAAVAKANRATHTVAVDGFKDKALELTRGRGVDIVLDPVGGDRFTDSLRSLAPGGRAWCSASPAVGSPRSRSIAFS